MSAVKMTQKEIQSELKALKGRYAGIRVVTAWEGRNGWVRVDIGKGVSGTIVDWGIDGPLVEVDDEDLERIPYSLQERRRFYPGGDMSNNWGMDRTWKQES